ncbi:MAG: hypothetical protein UHD09_09120 [Bifidobacterium sp.]|nr:hypothetical protein [Bifidobacterium sp.]
MADTNPTAPTDDAAELEALRAYKAEREAADAKAAMLAKVSKRTGVPAELLQGCTDEDSAMRFAHDLDQYAHPKPQGMPDQGTVPAYPAQTNALQSALFGD